MRKVLACGLAMAALSCNGGTPAPATLDTRHDACADCRMSVSSARFASQIVAPGEDPLFFDDLGCLAAYLREHAAQPAGAVAYVADHRTGRWVPAADAVFTQGTALETPMGSHVVAHASPASRDADEVARGGTSIRRRRVLWPHAPRGFPMTAVTPVRALVVCARQELVLAIRSRWTQTFAAAFAALSLAVAVSGYVLSGGSGVQDFARTAASLVQIVILLVPLTALMLGVLTLASDRGNAELLFSQPVSRGTILMGRVLGLFEALVSAQALGFGAAGLVIYSQAGQEGVSGYLVVAAASIVLTAICLGLAALIAAGNIGRRRSRALAVALVVWLVLVVLVRSRGPRGGVAPPVRRRIPPAHHRGDRQSDRRRPDLGAPGN